MFGAQGLGLSFEIEHLVHLPKSVQGVGTPGCETIAQTPKTQKTLNSKPLNP